MNYKLIFNGVIWDYKILFESVDSVLFCYNRLNYFEILFWKMIKKIGKGIVGFGKQFFSNGPKLVRFSVELDENTVLPI